MSKSTPVEEKNLPDGSTYTYTGENKEKIEALLRQLHPEKNNVEPKDSENDKPEEVKVVEENEEQQVENDETKEIKVPEESDRYNMEHTREIKVAEKSEKYNIKKEPTVETSSSFNSMYEKLFGTKVIQDDNKEAEKEIKKIDAIEIVNENVSLFKGIKEYNKPIYKIIGVVFGTYIIAEIEKEMYIINERVAREKIIFEKIKKNFKENNTKDSQMLLLPDIINLTSKEMEVAKENMNMFKQAGFVLEEFGENTIKLSGVPSACIQLNTKDLFYQIIEQINTVPRTDIQEKIDKFVEKIAEEIAKKEKPIENIQEVDSLLENLLQMKEPFVYVPNKQVALKMSKYDIERKFSRK